MPIRRARSAYGIGCAAPPSRNCAPGCAASPTRPRGRRATATRVVGRVRLALFDLAAVKETIDFARQSKKPFALVINAVPPRRDNTESPFVTQLREVLAGLNVPVRAGKISHRRIYSMSLECGEGGKEYDSESPAAAEISALWSAIDRSVKAIHGAYAGLAMHRVAA